MKSTRVMGVLAAVLASSCCLEQAPCVNTLWVEARVAANEAITVELCFREACDAAELAPEESSAELFLDGGAPYTSVVRSRDLVSVRFDFDVEPRVAPPADDDVVRLRIIGADGSVVLDETRMVEYHVIGDALCGGDCRGAFIEL
jgi:hypothetical protein